MTSVLFYNVFMRHESLFQDKQQERVQKIVENLPKSIGVLVCIELFDHHCQELFTKQLKDKGFHYRTKSYEGVRPITRVLQRLKQSKYHHGSGIIIFSKYRIVSEAFHAFSPVTKFAYEKYAHKGVVAAKIELPNRIACVCGTHLHSITWTCFNSYREKQWEECMSFLRSLPISWDEDVVIIGGDMNQDLRTAQSLIDGALETGLSLCKIHGVSLDPENPLVGTELGKNMLLKTICKCLFIRRGLLLDYVFSNQEGGRAQIQKMQNSSDHYAVEFELFSQISKK